MIIFITSIIITILFLFLGVLTLKKDWTKTFSLCLIFAFGTFVVGQEWFQGFIKSQVISIVLSSLKKYGDKLDEFHRTTESIQQDLSNQQENISKTQEDIKDVQQRIEVQQNKLENIELLVKNIFERITHEAFSHTQEKRMLIHEIEDRSTVVVFLLKSAPIYQTVQIQYHIYSQPKGSYLFHKNIAMLFLGDSVASLRDRSFVISYVADPTVVDVYSTLVRKEKEIYADESRLVWVSDEGNTMLVLDGATVTVTMDAEKKKYILSIPKATAETSSQ